MSEEADEKEWRVILRDGRNGEEYQVSVTTLVSLVKESCLYRDCCNCPFWATGKRSKCAIGEPWRWEEI